MPSSPPDEIAQAFGRRLTARREAAGIRIADLARHVNRSGPYISQLEAGIRVPGYYTLHRIADALGCRASDLTNDDNDTPRIEAVS